MSINPYVAPSADVTEIAKPKPARLVRAAIYCGVAGGCLLTLDFIYSIYLLATIASAAGHGLMSESQLSNFRDFASNLVVLGFVITPSAIAFGIHKRSRICAVLLFVLTLAGVIYDVFFDGSSPADWNLEDFAVPVACLLSIFGMFGTIRYHMLKTQLDT